MFGFVIGLLSLFLLVRVIRWGRYGYWGHGYHGRWGGHGWGHRWGGGWRRARWFAMRRLFERLETSPEQEKIFRAAAEDLRETLHKVRGEVQPARKEVAEALRAEKFDPQAFGKAFDRLDGALEVVRGAVSAQAGKIHEILDDEQREALADLIESAGGWRHGYGYGHGSV
jgi:uncharacterized membrane protein